MCKVASRVTSGSIVRARSRRSVFPFFDRNQTQTGRSHAHPCVAHASPYGRKRYSGLLRTRTPSSLTSACRKCVIGYHPSQAWACEICGRRFSVSSNLNRHARRCREKWAKSASSATDTPLSSAPSDPSERPSSSSSSSASSSPSSSIDGSEAYSLPSPQPIEQAKQRRGSVQHETDGPEHVVGKPQRRRRKGSPAEPWIPASLVNFNLDPITRSAPTPLPAAVPSTSEERNSFADTPLQAYHPSWWTGRLVGPSHVPRNEEVTRGRFYGKLIVF